MAIIQYGGGVVAMRGSIAGTTFQTNTSGPINRARSAPRRRTTSAQATIQTRTASLLVAWRNLSATYQTAWSDYAVANPRTDKYGTSKQNTGNNAFNTINSNLILCGSAALDLPPTPTLPPPVTETTLTPVGAELLIMADVPGADADTYLAYYITPPRLSAATLPRNALRQLLVIPYPGSGDIDYASEWSTLFALLFPPSTPCLMYLSLLVYTINAATGLVSTGLSTSARWVA